jgi:hypothetical protein
VLISISDLHIIEKMKNPSARARTLACTSGGGMRIDRGFIDSVPEDVREGSTDGAPKVSRKGADTPEERFVELFRQAVNKKSK